MRKKVVLFNPVPSKISRRKGVLPLALLSIARTLDPQKYEIVIIDEAVEDYSEASFSNAFCVGISAMIGYQIHSALKFAKRVRKANPDIPIVWGGWHPSILPEQTAADDHVDYVVRGQGEFTFMELLEALQNGRGYEKIPGLTFKEDGEIKSNPNRRLIDPNEFQPLPYDLIDMEKYIHSSEFGARTVTYLSSIGCPFTCGFCAEQVVYGKRWLPLSADRVISDFKFLKRQYSIDSIIINDSNFFTNEQRVAEICERMIAGRLDIKLGNANGRADQLTRYKEDTWQLMRDSGLKCILVGAETYDEGIMKAINKRATVGDTINLSKVARRFDIKIKYSFMVGLPVANRAKSLTEEFHEMIDFINSLYRINNESHFLLFLYTPFPGTPLFRKSIELGYKAPASLEEWGGFIEGLNHASTPWADKSLAKKVYQVNFYFPFISNSVHDIIHRYPPLIKWAMLPFERAISICMRLRMKYKIFSIPLEFSMIQILLGILKKRI
jgi:radical SAM superfamily enzyme YgiQ (UPF0313 family)